MNTQLATTSNAALSASGTDIKRVIDVYVSSIDGKPTSRALYARTLSAFFAWVAASGRTISALTVVDLIAYKEELLSNGKSSLTVASYVNSIRRFYEWAEANKIYPNIGKGVHAPKRRQEFRKKPLSVKKVGELLEHERNTQSLRDFAIVNLMVRTALRCVEVVRADIGDITYFTDANDNMVRVLKVQGKGRDEKDNHVKLTDAAFEPIRRYLETRQGEPDNAPLFASESHNNAGGRMTTRAVSAIAKNGLKSVGLTTREFTAHSLRHTVGTNILRAGGTLEQAQMTLRHSSPATTEIYVRMALEERRLTDSGEDLIDKTYKSVTAY